MIAVFLACVFVNCFVCICTDQSVS